MEAKVYFETYGCSYNNADTKIMENIVSKKYEVVEDIRLADIIVLNTCYVKTSTEHRIVNRIKELTSKYSGKKMIIAGCMSLVDKEKAVISNPRASLIGPQNIDKINEVIERMLRNETVYYTSYQRLDKSLLPKLWKKNEVIRIVQICEGCADACRYCCTRIARGPIFSFKTENILEEVRRGVLEGAKEFWLTAQDTSAYGIDSGTNLAELVEKVVEIDGQFYIRIGMMNPHHTLKILDKLIEIYKSPKVFKFLHLPVQSGSNRILKMMRRRYTIEDAEFIIESFRNVFPNITFATDIIVGYPGEEEDDFMKTLKFLEKTKPDIVNLSKFGKRPKTDVEINKECDVKVLKDRSRRVHELINRLQLEGNRKWIGWRGKILVDEKIGEDSVGRNEYYKNIVLKEEAELGTFLEVEVVDAAQHFLLGKILCR
ncbi:MAG: tRNA (N(6)-L-threonylcarbamoyladenosine(37)-C(2))-methylthiotransferase [Nitrososphaeria archaeon]|nr:tRNA (N(6)-L-threonylcarbamoyladenosine(37)-C(2))-methylthiotransferase [Nitrososphaeria archaeon]